MKRPWPLFSVDELAALPEPAWLVDKHLTDGVSVLYGPPGHGKTFLTLSWALAIATGTRWFTHDTKQAPVLYVSGEGGGGLSKRIAAWRFQQLSQTPEFYAALGTVQLTNHEHVGALMADVHATGAKLLIIDTLARSLAGADENSARDMGLAVNALDAIRRRTGCASLVVHHSGKDAAGGPRGSSALFGAADTLMHLESRDKVMTLRCEKQKDAPPFRSLSFELTPMAGSCALTGSRPSGFVAGGEA